MSRTRIKVCGITREEDLHAAVAAGVDAVGFVFYPKSPRLVSAARARQLIDLLPPFVTAVGLFVNEEAATVQRIAVEAGLQLLQFHGDETPAYCGQFGAAVGSPPVGIAFGTPHGTPTPSGTPLGAQLDAQFALPYIKAARMTPQLDLLKFRNQFIGARGVLLDAFVEGYGGGGEVFDWSLIPQQAAGSDARFVVSGGLRPSNVGGAIKALRPYGVDVSSGVEAAKGIKDAALLRQFVSAVRDADAQLELNEAQTARAQDEAA